MDVLSEIGINFLKNEIEKFKCGGKIEKMKSGSYIHIKEKNKGKFTESAKRAGEGVQEHAHNVVNNPNSTELQRKRAQFAINAKKFNH